ncbi:MAG: hypothetical protein RLY21_766 [Planctomycetota bacterium]|jgi:hypothetical protein
MVTQRDTATTARLAPRRTRRAGFALMDAVIAGILLAIGMVAVLSVAGQALALARRGEVDVRAAAAIDELLGKVLTEGPRDFPELHPTAGAFEEDSPYADFEYAITIDQGGAGVPAEVQVVLTHATGRSFTVVTRIAEKRGEEPDPVRFPTEPIDREARIAEQEARREGQPAAP